MDATTRALLAAVGVALITNVHANAAAAPNAPATKTKPPRIEQREPTEEERASFDAWFSEHASQAVNGPPSLFAPAFEVQRQGRSAPWQVLARVDSAPRHFTPDLCRQVRSSFVYDAAAPKGQRWSVAVQPPQWYVWLAQPKTICAAARYTVLLDPAVPAADATELFRQHRELLIRARLLFAGNSQCARQRALTFRLSAIEPAPPAYGSPVMFGMVFESDRDTVAKVAVRKHRGEYTAWNVSCPG
jgi:hypothetical protein